MSKIDILKKKIEENKDVLNNEQHELSYQSLMSINRQLKDELIVELENENLMLKTKLAMYEELIKRLELRKGFELRSSLGMYYGSSMQKEVVEYVSKLFDFNSNEHKKIEDLLNQIKSLDKKCDGECII